MVLAATVCVFGHRVWCVIKNNKPTSTDSGESESRGSRFNMNYPYKLPAEGSEQWQQWLCDCAPKTSSGKARGDTVKTVLFTVHHRRLTSAETTVRLPEKAKKQKKHQHPPSTWLHISIYLLQFAQTRSSRCLPCRLSPTRMQRDVESTFIPPFGCLLPSNLPMT